MILPATLGLGRRGLARAAVREDSAERILDPSCRALDRPQERRGVPAGRHHRRMSEAAARTAPRARSPHAATARNACRANEPARNRLMIRWKPPSQGIRKEEAQHTPGPSKASTRGRQPHTPPGRSVPSAGRSRWPPPGRSRGSSTEGQRAWLRAPCTGRHRPVHRAVVGNGLSALLRVSPMRSPRRRPPPVPALSPRSRRPRRRLPCPNGWRRRP